MDALTEPGIRKVVGVFASQTGKTEAINNIIGWLIHLNPGPILLVQPTLEMAHAWSKDRLAPMLRDSPVLRGLVADARSRDSGNTVLHKQFPGGHITIAGANSPASLASRPIRVLICDEVDRYQDSAGSEGDPVALATTRTTSFWNAIVIMISSPGTRGVSRIEFDWERSDKREWFVPCHACSHWQVLRWSQVQWDKNPDGEPVYHTARYVCEKCGEAWDDAQRWRNNKLGAFRKTAPDSDIAGLRLPAFAAPWEQRRLGLIVKQWHEAQGNPELLRVFVNTVLAEWWEDENESLSDDVLLQRREDWSHVDADVPTGGVVLTMAVDVQGDRIEYEVVAWGRGEESWSIDYGVIPGDVRKDATVLESLDRLLDRVWTHESGAELYIRACCVDAGYASEDVHRYTKPRQRRLLPNGYSQFVFAVKGSNNPFSEVWPTHPTRVKKGSPTNLWVVGTNAAKEQVMGRLAKATPGPGYCHFSTSRDREYFKGLTSEKCEIKFRAGRKRKVWELKRKGLRNEPFDLRVYNYAAIVALQNRAFGLDLEAEAVALEQLEPTRYGVKASGSPRKDTRRFSKGVV
jgi:phage terminase large subunit GpA-like protein